MEAILVLEDGCVFEGQSFGAEGEKIGRVVFHTGMVGYQELMTDPACRGLLLTMAYPLMGNYGINNQGYESPVAQAEALIVKECSRIYSNWLARESLQDFMKKNNVVGIEGIDTRALVVHLRDNGEMSGIVSTKDFNVENLKEKIKASWCEEKNLIQEVTSSEPVFWQAPEHISCRVALVDLGAANSLFHNLYKANCQVIRLPARASAADILALNPDGIIFSAGPEDLKSLHKIVEKVKNLLGEKPLLGISSGNLLLALALGAKIKQMKCGHRGVNQPVRSLKTGSVAITLQNHCFVIDETSICRDDIEVSEVNMNDESIEVIRSKNYPALGVQYIPGDFDAFLKECK
ncbi:glutamine-hydrolyzing carbamoyl-phosphate synthase small subunit [Candidatus Aerophobetes bacterium]|nr:glutamine-hydrolyzing carbamoyl-phosphate synthase small subunit [Candidatus Aerophobetes bacterium]